MPAAEVIVAGAGPAGLAAAAEAHRRGLLVEVLEAAPSVGASWRRHYDRLHLGSEVNCGAGRGGQAVPA